MKPPTARAWQIPAALIFLSLIPFVATVNRLHWLLTGSALPDATIDRLGGDWGLIVIHVAFGSLFLVLVAFQFSPELRKRRSGWHRGAGKVAMVSGVLAGLSAAGLVLAYPSEPPATPLLDAVRVGFGVALSATNLLAFAAIRRGNVAAHRAWMIRAVAIGIAGTTQAGLLGLLIAVTGPLTPWGATAMITLGFLINSAFAEWRIGRVHDSTPMTTHKGETQ
jgi:Predicted membrane protein (DUF2306)